MTNQQQLNFLSKSFQVIFVDSSNGKLETTEVIKDKNGFSNLTKFNDYTLNKCNHSLLYCLVNEIKNLSFFDVKIEKIKFEKLNFFERIFLKKKIVRLQEKVLEMSIESSWMIVPSFLAQSLNIFDNIQIIENPDISCKEIYFGNYDSFKIVINSNNLDFSVIDKNNIKVLQVI